MTRLLTALIAVAPTTVFVEGLTSWYAQLGAANIGFSENATISAGGATVNPLILHVGWSKRF